MNQAVTGVLNGATEFVRALGPGRLAAMGAVAAVLIGFFAIIMMRWSAPEMVVLFSDLTLQDSNAIIGKLETQGIEHELKQDGAVILVPRDNVLRLRMQMAEGGLPAGGGVGYEIFDKGDTLGATSFVQNVNKLRAIEGELSRTIRSIDRVRAARVHLVIPERQLFQRDAPEPSAAIVIQSAGAIDATRIRAIQHLVASSVQNLKPGRVSIVDETGRLLASGRGNDDAVGGEGADERHSAIEKRLAQDIEEIVSSVVGIGRARVRVTAEMDYNKVTQTQELFDPDSRVLRSSQAREESSAQASAQSNNTVSVGNELPSANAEAAPAGSDKDKSEKTEETFNYEISRTTRTEVLEPGRVKRVSVAVLVDGSYAKGEDGKIVYAPRAQAEIDQITALVRSAVGFDQARGDQVQVTNLPFAAGAAPEIAGADGGLFDMTRTDWFRVAEQGVLLLITVVILFVVVRPLVRRILTPEGSAPRGLTIAAPGPLALAGLLPAPAQDGSETMPAIPPSRTAELIKLAKVTGEVRAASLREVGEIVQNNPDEAVTLVRQWLGQAG